MIVQEIMNKKIDINNLKFKNGVPNDAKTIYFKI